MARPRTPTETLKARGGYANNPGRFAERHGNAPAETRPLGDPPPGMPEAVASAWFEIVEMAPPGVLKAADRAIVESAARALVELREPFEHVVTKQGVEQIPKTFDAKAAATLMRCLVEMGLTPASRSKIQVAQKPDAPKDDPWGALQ